MLWFISMEICRTVQIFEEAKRAIAFRLLVDLAPSFEATPAVLPWFPSRCMILRNGLVFGWGREGRNQ